MGVIALDIMVIIHEAGHYFTAKIFHIETDSLHIGFGPQIRRSNRNAKLTFGIIPFGGACKLDTLSLYSTHPIKRILMYLAGPVSNAVFAILCFSLFLLINGTNIVESIKISLEQCLFEVKMFHDAIFSVITGRAKIGDIISGAFKASENIGLITVAGFRSSFITGLYNTLYLVASVSLSLGVANMLPIPALDGGFILISIIELITRRTFSEKFYLIVQIVGLVLLLVVVPIARRF